MRKILLFISLFVFIKANSQNYYYAYETRIPIEMTDAVVLKNTIDNKKFVISNNLNVLSADSLYTIVEYSGRKSYNNTTFPVYRTSGGYFLGTIDEILFLPKNDSASNIIKDSFPIEIIEENSIYALAKIIDSTKSALSVANSIQESGLVIFSHPNFLVKVQFFEDTIRDPYFEKQFYLNSVGQTINDNHVTTPDADINALEAWSITKGVSDIKIAVIDKGVTSNHPDLPNTRQIRLPNSNFAATEDGSNPNDPSPSSVSPKNHGNGCAGIIGATHNNEGVAGIAPNCKIMPIRLPESAPVNTYASAITFAKDNGADIISNSWGFDTNVIFPTIVNAIENAAISGRNNKGCVITFAMGNTANRITGYNGRVHFPANSCNRIIAVGASDRNNEVANYSPDGTNLSVVAPSHKAYKTQISTENFEVWTMDIPGATGDNPKDGVYLPSSGTNYSAYTGRFGGTSAASPQVAGVAALMLSVNPNLTAAQVKSIIEQTAREVGNYYYDHTFSDYPNKGWCSQMGYGLVDAYAAVKKAMDVDLYISDTAGDNGAENWALDCMWNSPDIWIENENNENVDSLLSNKEYYVCVKIHNKSGIPTTGTEKLHLNWAKAGVNLPWPSGWDGTTQLECGKYPPMSGMVGDSLYYSVPIILPYSSVVVKIPWTTPNAEDYDCDIFEGSAEQWHFCLLARVHDSEIIEGENSNDYDIGQFVNCNNNVAWKNLTVLGGHSNRAVVWLQNHFKEERLFTLRFNSPLNSKNEPLYKYAETYIRFSPNVVAGWQEGGSEGNGFEQVEEHRFFIPESSAEFKNILLPPNSIGMLETEVNFFSNVVPNCGEFTFDIAMYDEKGETLYGGEHYKVIRDPDREFEVKALEDQVVMPETHITFSAVNIGEPATYVWYNAAGDSIASGTTLSTTATQSQQYRLSVQATADGYKGYDTVSVVVRNGAITAISPNPATNQAVVSYTLSNQVQSGTVQIANTTGIVLSSTAFTASQTSTTLNLQNLVAGQYNVRLVSVTGEVLDTKTLIVQ